MRFPTSRNTMTLPGNVPKYRRPPDTAEFLLGCRSTQRVKLDDRAMRRNADAIVHLTSGDIGSHYLGRTPSDVRIHMKPLSHRGSPRNDSYSNVPETNSARRHSHEPTSNVHNNNGHNLQSRSGTASARSQHDTPVSQRSGLSTFREEINYSSNKYMTTLKHLDGGFGRNARKDLMTACLPPRPSQEFVWAGTTIQHNALQTKAWALKLRRDSS
jgi:hypothetical protein